MAMGRKNHRRPGNGGRYCIGISDQKVTFHCAVVEDYGITVDDNVSTLLEI